MTFPQIGVDGIHLCCHDRSQCVDVYRRSSVSVYLVAFGGVLDGYSDSSAPLHLNGSCGAKSSECWIAIIHPDLQCGYSTVFAAACFDSFQRDHVVAAAMMQGSRYLDLGREFDERLVQ